MYPSHGGPTSMYLEPDRVTSERPDHSRMDEVDMGCAFPSIQIFPLNRAFACSGATYGLVMLMCQSRTRPTVDLPGLLCCLMKW